MSLSEINIPGWLIRTAIVIFAMGGMAWQINANTKELGKRERHIDAIPLIQQDLTYIKGAVKKNAENAEKQNESISDIQRKLDVLIDRLER